LKNRWLSRKYTSRHFIEDSINNKIENSKKILALKGKSTSVSSTSKSPLLLTSITPQPSTSHAPAEPEGNGEEISCDIYKIMSAGIISGNNCSNCNIYVNLNNK